MTRDKAVQVAKDTFVNGSGLCQDRLVDMFVALGMLTLEEPKGLEAQLATALGWPEDGRSHGELVAALKMSGLKLVVA